MVISVTLAPMLAEIVYGIAEALIGGSIRLHTPSLTGAWRPNTSFPAESVSSTATGTLEGGDKPQTWLDFGACWRTMLEPYALANRNVSSANG